MKNQKMRFKPGDIIIHDKYNKSKQRIIGIKRRWSGSNLYRIQTGSEQISRTCDYIDKHFKLSLQAILKRL